ncbi:hypothetical protein V5O48_009742 [Marasmius crinis-equi]|uniref:Uncharacterized protein n=1 Tax=Marasmius crinis-equi TaxID=585013 RepID=A0ABR3FAE9_9AGAR
MSEPPSIPLTGVDSHQLLYVQHLQAICNATTSPATPPASGMPENRQTESGYPQMAGQADSGGWASPDLGDHWNDSMASLTNTVIGSIETPTTSGWASFSLEDGRALKKGKMLSAHSEREYDEYLKDREKGPAVAMARQQLMLLQIRDHVKETMEEVKSKWKPGPALVKACKEYANNVALSPRLHAYRGKKLPNMTFDVMKKIGVSDLPASHDLGRVDQCVAIITRQLTDQRYSIKSKLGQSLYKEDGSYDAVDIGTLFEDCVGTSRTPVSAPALMRFAYLWAVWLRLYKEQLKADEGGGAKPGKKRKNGKDPALNELRNEDFWIYVDNDLKTLRKMCQKPEELAGVFKRIYDDDVKLYGANNAPVTELKDLEDWLAEIHNTSAFAVNTGETEEGSKGTSTQSE